MKTYRNPETLHQPIALYTHQVEVTGTPRWLVLSGQIGMEKDGSLPDGSVEQFERALSNVYLNLQAANMEISDLVKLTIYLVSDADTTKRREVLSAWLKGHKPCMTLLYVAALANPKIKAELDALACKDA